MNKTINDLFDRAIQPGDKIVYSAADGRSAVLRRGVVIEAYYKYDKYSGNASPRVLVEAERLAHRYKGPSEWQPMEKRITLTFPHRIIVVDRNAW